jgi:hypothetical protein
MTDTAKSSHMMSRTTADSGGGDYDDDTWDMSWNEGVSAGHANNYALSTARAHLSAVAEELAMIQSRFSDGRLPSRIGSADTGSEQGATANQVQQELERNLRYMQGDLDDANARADQLAKENEQMLTAQARLEADLRAARHSLEEMSLRLQHMEIDRRKKQGAPSDTISSSEEAVQFDAKAPGADSSAKSPEEMLAPKSRMTQSKHQIVSAVRAAQVELAEERKRQARLERRIQKDQERLEQAVAFVEAQQMANKALKKKYLQAEAQAQGNHSRLQQISLQSSRPGSSEVSARHLAAPPFGGYGSNQGSSSLASMSRQKSAPTRLPSVSTRST